MVEPEKPLKKKDQIAMDEEVARNLEAQLQAELEEEERISRLKKKHFAALRAQEKRSKPPTKEQKRNTMSTYLKNIAGYKHNQLKSKSYDKIHEMFDKEMKRVNTFVDMNTKLVKSSETRTKESSKRAGDELESDNSKKQKIDEHVEAKKDDDQEDAEMKKHIEIVKDYEVAIDAIPLATKPPGIVKYKIVIEGKFVYFQLIKANGSSKRYLSMIKMLQNNDREDLETLWKLVKAKHGNTRLEDKYERVLWGDMKIQKMNIKFKGGLLGFKDFKMILRVTSAQSDHFILRLKVYTKGVSTASTKLVLPRNSTKGVSTASTELVLPRNSTKGVSTASTLTRTVLVINDDKNLAFLTLPVQAVLILLILLTLDVSMQYQHYYASTETSTASFSDATVYAFLSTQPQGSQLVHEDLEQIHDDDLEEMDLKWNMAYSNSQLNEKGFVDSGCSRHMSGNIDHLLDFKEFDGGYVTFGGGANGGRINVKGCLMKVKQFVFSCQFGRMLHIEDASSNLPQVITGSRIISTATPEVNTATSEGLMGPIPTTEDYKEEDQGFDLAEYFTILMRLLFKQGKDDKLIILN
ncbi:hypothetical protein Tco_0795107 [Tanacetum coccineum]